MDETAATLEERVAVLERLVLALVETDRAPSLEEQHRAFVERVRRAHPELEGA